METRKFEYRQLLKDKRLWVASFLITWAAALQGHMMWLQRQDSFKHKFGSVNQQLGSEETAENQHVHKPKYPLGQVTGSKGKKPA